LQGHFEHARGTTSHYGRVYNFLFFNDGYHVEHHLKPGAHWSRLPEIGRRDSHNSPWPPVLRWLETASAAGLEWLERLVLRSAILRRFVLDRHARAFRELLPAIASARTITIVGGGLFPRTALVLRRLLPGAVITIVDSSAANLAEARLHLDDSVALVHATYDSRVTLDADLVVLPLAFRGDRRRAYREPPAALTIVHDWIWRPGANSARVSWLLLKRLNLVARVPARNALLRDAYVSAERVKGQRVAAGAARQIARHAAPIR
jgi:hypothetical protein